MMRLLRFYVVATYFPCIHLFTVCTYIYIYTYGVFPFPLIISKNVVLSFKLKGCDFKKVGNGLAASFGDFTSCHPFLLRPFGHGSFHRDSVTVIPTL